MDKHDDLFDALSYAYTVKEVERIKKELTNLPLQYLNLKPNEKSFQYYKGFYDATHQFMQTFEKLIEAGVFSGTKSNSSN